MSPISIPRKEDDRNPLYNSQAFDEVRRNLEDYMAPTFPHPNFTTEEREYYHSGRDLPELYVLPTKDVILADQTSTGWPRSPGLRPLHRDNLNPKSNPPPSFSLGSRPGLSSAWRPPKGASSQHNTSLSSVEQDPFFIVVFKNGRAAVFHCPIRLVKKIKVGDLVVVEGNPDGRDLGRVSSNTFTEAEEFISRLRSKGKNVVVRKLLEKAQPEHLRLLGKKADDEALAQRMCQGIARAQGKAIQVVDAEYQWDGGTLAFYYTSEKGMDLFELHEELLRLFQAEIILKRLKKTPPVSKPLANLPKVLPDDSKFQKGLNIDPDIPITSKPSLRHGASVSVDLQASLTVKDPVHPVSATTLAPAVSSSDKNRADLLRRVQATFADKQEYKKLLACRDVNAQKLLDMFQRLLDILTDLSPSFRRNLIVATQRLAAASELYPASYELSKVTTPELPECSGASADIYKGDFGGRAVCVKTIRLHKSTQVNYFMKVISKEAILWGQLRHPNLVPFYGIYHYKGRLSLIAPWMDNGDIEDYLKYHTTSNRVVLAYDVAQGLEFLHQNGIIHGDLKGKNILVNNLGRACVADFGLSSISDQDILAWTSFSSASSKGGTVRYQAPELFDLESGEQQHNTTASDMYAWACVAYEIFAGEAPFAHLTRELVIMKYVSNGGQPSRPLASSISWSVWGLTEDIWILMQTCWSPHPGARPPVGAVVDYLSSSLPSRAPNTGRDQALSPGQFREMMRQRSDEDEMEMTIQTFESLLHGFYNFRMSE